jgi:hypothetical protein
MSSSAQELELVQVNQSILMEEKTNKMRTATTRYHVPLPLMCGKTSRNSSKPVPKVRRSGMALSVSIAIKSTLVALVVAPVTSDVIGTNVLRGARSAA